MCNNNPDAHLYRRTIQTFEEKTGPFTSFDKVPTPDAVIIAGMVSAECRLLARQSDLNGTVTAVGTGSSAVVLNGAIGGTFSLYSTLSATGYAVSTRTTNIPLLDKLIAAGNNQTLLSGSTLVIGNNVAGGIYFAGAPVGTVAGSTADLTGDGVADSAEGTASISQAGSAPAK